MLKYLFPLVVALLTITSLYAGDAKTPEPEHLQSSDIGPIGQDTTPDDDYDRLDGMGKSKKEVHVIEWAGNLEIHVYPYGSLQGLALKLDETNKNKPVMVIGYRFKDSPKEQLIRRNILGIKLPNFKAYVDPREKEFDKIIISANTLAQGVKPFSLEPEPTQLYPDGHPMLAQKETGPSSRAPASVKKDPPQKAFDEESGAIKHFFGN